MSNLLSAISARTIGRKGEQKTADNATKRYTIEVISDGKNVVLENIVKNDAPAYTFDRADVLGSNSVLAYDGLQQTSNIGLAANDLLNLKSGESKVFSNIDNTTNKITIKEKPIHPETPIQPEAPGPPETPDQLPLSPEEAAKSAYDTISRIPNSVDLNDGIDLVYSFITNACENAVTNVRDFIGEGPALDSATAVAQAAQAAADTAKALPGSTGKDIFDAALAAAKTAAESKGAVITGGGKKIRRRKTSKRKANRRRKTSRNL